MWPGRVTGGPHLSEFLALLHNLITAHVHALQVRIVGLHVANVGDPNAQAACLCPPYIQHLAACWHTDHSAELRRNVKARHLARRDALQVTGKAT